MNFLDLREQRTDREAYETLLRVYLNMFEQYRKLQAEVDELRKLRDAAYVMRYQPWYVRVWLAIRNQ